MKCLSEKKLSKENLKRLNTCLEKARDFPDSRHFRAHAILYADVETTGEFYFRKIEQEVETQLGNPTEMMTRVQALQTWTEEFANLFEELFPGYSSWYLSLTPPLTTPFERRPIGVSKL